MLSTEEKELLKIQQNNYLYLLISCLVLTVFFGYQFYAIYTQQEKNEMKLTILFCGAVWIGVMSYFGKIYFNFTQDLKQNQKISIEGKIEKISWTIGEGGGNTSILMAGKKYHIPKEGSINYSDLYDFIQVGDKAILHLAPKSKFLLGIKRIDENYADEESTLENE